MRWNPETRIKKLALAYHTGWEYTPGSREAGSVLTDLFVEMMRNNQRRYEGIWEKHRQEFLSVIPPQKRKGRRLKAGLSVRASGESHGKRISRQTQSYMTTNEGRILRFALQEELLLTAARLTCAVYQKGLCAWLTYEGGRGRVADAFEIPLFQAAGTELGHPVFRWKFPDLCNGKASVCYTVEFVSREIKGPDLEEQALPGCWTVSDGVNTCPLEWTQSGDGCRIQGLTPDFARNLEETVYELCLEIPAEEPLPASWLKVLCQGIVLKEEQVCRELALCLTAEGACSGERLLPFTDVPEPGACCYLACDGAGALKGREATLLFSERFETEEKLPPPVPKEYQKLYRKYPWLQTSESLQEWSVRETVWEYFDGSLWRELPGSREWKTGCGPGESGERKFSWVVPGDMRPCSVEGEKHFYIRLRAVRVDHAYAACYRKVIPVLEHVRLETPKRRIEPAGWELPDVSEAEHDRMLLGFDREINCDNRWYTGSESLAFSAEQIRGRAVRFGREAFWVELESREPVVLPALYANYVEVLELLEEEEQKPSGMELPAGTAFHVQTGNLGILDALSVYDARYDGRGTVLWEEEQWRESYPVCFGRVVSVMDVDLLLQKSYPDIKVFWYGYKERDRELTLVLEHSGDRETLRRLLPEIREWLEETLHQMGLLWLKDCHVICLEKDTEGERADGEVIG